MLILCLSGTIPVDFEIDGRRYHIPVEVWVPHQFPQAAAIAYVAPAQGIAIRTGPSVDATGLVTLQPPGNFLSSLFGAASPESVPPIADACLVAAGVYPAAAEAVCVKHAGVRGRGPAGSLEPSG